MGFRVRIGWWVLLIVVTVSSVLCSAGRNTIPPLSVHDEDWVLMEGRSLLGVRVNDYSDPSANRGHDPPSTRKPTTTSSGGAKSGRRG